MECKLMPGMKVVCMATIDSFYKNKYSSLIRVGNIYTIRDVFIGINILNEEVPSVHLEEITGIPGFRGIEWGFSARYFKPLETNKAMDTIYSWLSDVNTGNYDKSLEDDNPYLEKVKRKERV